MAYIRYILLKNILKGRPHRALIDSSGVGNNRLAFQGIKMGYYFLVSTSLD